MNYNKVVIVGRVTADPQVRATPSGQSVTSMGVATNRLWTDKQGVAQQSTEFHNVVIWGKTAELASTYLQKGSLVLVEGRLETRTWDDKSGAVRKATEIIAENIQFGPRSTTNEAQARRSAEQPKSPVPSTDEDVPIINLDDDGEVPGDGFKQVFGEDEDQPF